MINIMFWNAALGKQVENIEKKRECKIEETLIKLIIEYECDIIVLAEYDRDLEEICDKLALKGKNYQECKTIAGSIVKVLIDNRLEAEIIRDAKRYCIFNIDNNLGTNFLLVGIHLPSKLYGSGLHEQKTITADLMEKLREAEGEVEHKKVVIIGDFNANPFEEIMIDFNLFHSIPYSKIVSEKKERRSSGVTRQMFYNPMWNFLSEKEKMNGSYYHVSSGAVCFYYNIFDQVLFSADLVQKIQKESIKIITKLKEYTLLDNKGKPNKKDFSDHLPIFFAIMEEF